MAIITEVKGLPGGSIVGSSDVELTSPSDGQALVYDSGASKWINDDIALSLTSEELVTNASQSYCDNTKNVTNIVSGGTAGDERVILPNFTLDISGRNSLKNGTIHTVYFKTQTNGADVIKVFPGAEDAPIIIQNFNGNMATAAGGAVLSFPGDSIVFVWKDTGWFADVGANQNETVYTIYSFYVPGGGTTGQGLVKTDNYDGAVGWGDVISSTPALITGSDAKTNILTINFTATFGAVTPLTGTEVTQAITGLLTTDQVHVECVSAPPSGYLPPNARVSAADTLSLFFNTAVALGITLGSLDFRVTVIR